MKLIIIPLLVASTLLLQSPSASEFHTAIPLSPLNSSYTETDPHLSLSGDELYFASDRPGGMGGLDIWVSRRGGEGWLEPENLGAPVNSQWLEVEPCLSPSGDKLYLTSNRPAGGGQSDIFVSTRQGPDGDFGEPEILPQIINGSINTNDCFVTYDGTRLYFNTYGRSGNHHLWDIWYSEIVGGILQPPVNAGSTVNSFTRNQHSSVPLLGDQLLFVGTSESGGANARIYSCQADGNNWAAPQLIDVYSGGMIHGAKISADGERIFFSANQASTYNEDSDFDLYVTSNFNSVDMWCHY